MSMGVGLGVGIPLVLAVLDGFYFLSKKRKSEGGYEYGQQAPKIS